MQNKLINSRIIHLSEEWELNLPGVETYAFVTKPISKSEKKKLVEENYVEQPNGNFIF